MSLFRTWVDLDLGDKRRIERRIEATDRQIDELVYRLYGLTAEEIAIVEGGKA